MADHAGVRRHVLQLFRDVFAEVFQLAAAGLAGINGRALQVWRQRLAFGLLPRRHLDPCLRFGQRGFRFQDFEPKLGPKKATNLLHWPSQPAVNPNRSKRPRFRGGPNPQSLGFAPEVVSRASCINVCAPLKRKYSEAWLKAHLHFNMLHRTLLLLIHLSPHQKRRSPQIKIQDGRLQKKAKNINRWVPNVGIA